MMVKGKGLLLGALAAVGTAAILGAVGFAVVGVSARSEPPAFEVTLARSARHWLIPRAARATVNPVAAGPDVLDSAMRHWADHCASCHGNDGRGNTALGRGLYPRAPNMTLAATQKLSDGELFWIIENGIKLTGIGIDEQRNANPGIGETRAVGRKLALGPGYLKAALGGHLPALLRDDAGGMGSVVQRDL